MLILILKGVLIVFQILCVIKMGFIWSKNETLLQSYFFRKEQSFFSYEDEMKIKEFRFYEKLFICSILIFAIYFLFF